MYHPTWSLFSKCYLVLIHVHWWPAWSVAWLSCSFWCHGVFFTFSSSSFPLMGPTFFYDFRSQSCVWVSLLKALLLVEGDLHTTQKKIKPTQNNNKNLQNPRKPTQGLCFLALRCVKVCCVFPSKAQVAAAKCFWEETGQRENWMRWSHGRKMRTVNNDL